MKTDRFSAWFAWVVLALFAVLWFARWAFFPLVLDPYYHLFIAQQINAAGGPFAYETWEYAPVGRWHLYPPVLHLLLAGLLKLGCSPIGAIRLLTGLLPVCLLVTLFLVTRRLFTPMVALSCLGMAVSPFAFHLHSGITLAATLAMIELLWLYDALERRRWLASGCLATLLCYTHLGLPWVGLVSIVVYAFWARWRWKEIVPFGWGFLLAVPWWWHLVAHRASFTPFPRYENELLELSPVICLLAMAGIAVCLRLKGKYRWVLACWLGFFLFSYNHRYRWLSGEGMLPLFLLSGIGFWSMVEWLNRYFDEKRPKHTTVSLALFSSLWMGCVLFSPTVLKTPAGWAVRWPDGAFWHLLNAPSVARKAIDNSFYSPQTQQVIDAVRTHTVDGEILWSNAPYALGLVASVARRPMSSAMLNEVAPSAGLNPRQSAHLIVWFKFDRLLGVAEELPAIPPGVAVDDQALALIWRQSGSRALVQPPKAVMPLALAWGFLVLLAGLAAWDFKTCNSRRQAAIKV